jgi:hypothetical protein
MSIFKDSGIVLKVQKSENKDFIYHILSERFWKVIVTKKLKGNEKILDIWYHINYEIEVKNSRSINKIKMIKIINEFNSNNKSFKEINNFLILINIVLKKVVFWVENPKINEIIKIISNCNKSDLETKLILAQLKVLDLLWELSTNHNNETISKILNFINKNTFKNILKLSWINNDLKKELQNIL